MVFNLIFDAIFEFSIILHIPCKFIIYLFRPSQETLEKSTLFAYYSRRLGTFEECLTYLTHRSRLANELMYGLARQGLSKYALLLAPSMTDESSCSICVVSAIENGHIDLAFRLLEIDLFVKDFQSYGAYVLFILIKHQPKRLRELIFKFSDKLLSISSYLLEIIIEMNNLDALHVLLEDLPLILEDPWKNTYWLGLMIEHNAMSVATEFLKRSPHLSLLSLKMFITTHNLDVVAKLFSMFISYPAQVDDSVTSMRYLIDLIPPFDRRYVLQQVHYWLSGGEEWFCTARNLALLIENCSHPLFKSSNEGSSLLLDYLLQDEPPLRQSTFRQRVDTFLKFHQS